jgi:hypothetical protein
MIELLIRPAHVKAAKQAYRETGQPTAFICPTAQALMARFPGTQVTVGWTHASVGTRNFQLTELLKKQVAGWPERAFEPGVYPLLEPEDLPAEEER